MTLLDSDWTPEQAQGLLDSLKLNCGMPDWRPEALKRLHDWCSTHICSPRDPEEVRNLMKVLRAGIVILEDTTEGDMDEPFSLTKRVAAVTAAPPK